VVRIARKIRQEGTDFLMVGPWLYILQEYDENGGQFFRVPEVANSFEGNRFSEL